MSDWYKTNVFYRICVDKTAKFLIDLFVASFFMYVGSKLGFRFSIVFKVLFFLLLGDILVSYKYDR